MACLLQRQISPLCRLNTSKRPLEVVKACSVAIGGQYCRSAAARATDGVCGGKLYHLKNVKFNLINTRLQPSTKYGRCLSYQSTNGVKHPVYQSLLLAATRKTLPFNIENINVDNDDNNDNDGQRAETAKEHHPPYYTRLGLSNWFSHGKHFLHDTLVTSGAVSNVTYFVSPDKSQLIMITDVGDNVCGHDDVMHGGFTALLFDNSFATLSFLNNKLPVTKNLNMQFIQPISPKKSLVLKTKIVAREVDAKSRPALTLHGALYYHSDIDTEFVNVHAKGKAQQIGMAYGVADFDDAHIRIVNEEQFLSVKPLSVANGVLIDVG